MSARLGHPARRLWRELGAATEALLAVLLPPRCARCDEPLPALPRHGLCARCAELVEDNTPPRCARCDLPSPSSPCRACAAAPPPFDAVVAPWLYGGAVADLVRAVKFARREDVALALGRMLADDPRVRAALAGASALVPVPLGNRRRRTRGFNQSAVLARVLGRELRVPVRYALCRRRETDPQSDLPLEARRANVAGAFVARERLHGRTVLVDDVVTSGETARHAASALVAAGAREVVVVAVARTPP